MWSQRLLVGLIAFLLCMAALTAQKIGLVSLPAQIVAFASLPFLFSLPESFVSYMGNTGLGIYFSVIWGLIAASCLGPIPSSLAMVRNVVLLGCIFLALMLLLIPRLR